mmetsp:Transcript_43736/g.99620  ORF Transcript_43736/g.99620 Transcript_43736/m.99620 type:complete len:158 (+) Transcript_43736:46-519(+)
MGVDATERLLGASMVGGMAGFVTGSLRSVLSEPMFKSQMTTKAGMNLKSYSVVATQTAMFAGIGAVFVGGTIVAENVRGKDDMYNHMIGACLAGSLFAMKSGTIQSGAIACPLLAFTAAAVDYSGSTIRGSREQFAKKHPGLLARFDIEEGTTPREH